MRYGKLALLIPVVLFLSGCLAPETPCHYFEVDVNNLTHNQWNVDSLHLYLYDSMGIYHLDTVYLNQGTIQFVNETYDYSNCLDSGLMILTRINGSSVTFNYQFINNYSATVISPVPYGLIFYLNTTTSLDGYPQPYGNFSYYSYANNTLTINEGHNLAGYIPSIDSFVLTRYWEFALTKK